MLNQNKKEYFKKILSQRLDELLAEADKTITGITDLKDESPDFIDQASMEADIDFVLHIRERENRLIGKIKNALERLEQGTFGICEVCGNGISEERLKARLGTTLCIACKKKQESKEKIKGL
ncbi:MAG: TraR/DksA C4-type zinc finger protein [Deltaproteobacteria bacterium]|nr:TraR/DksA C4-type zinc finger protein [Deltaproteobacteria bacterium]MBW2344939.1 TraR/DksA C4-type zinc finger protein [Deltaproteobacteria bacterium]